MPARQPEPIRVDGQRLCLREFAPGDVDGLLRIYGDPVATRHLSFEPRTREQVSGIVADAIEQAAATPRTVYALVVTRRDSSELIGMARLATGEHRSGQIGFALRPDQWGHGLGTETVRLLLALAFDKIGLHRVWGARSPLNDASARTMATAGMIPEGRIRDHVHVRGAWRDSLTHSILEHEWRATKRHAPEMPPAQSADREE